MVAQADQSPLLARSGPIGPRIRRRYQFGAGGLLYVFVTLLIALGAFNSGNNLLYWSFGLALALLLVSGVLSGVMLMGVRVEREWVSGASVGQTLRIRYRIRNLSRFMPAFALTIEEVGFEVLPQARRSLLGRVMGSARRVSVPTAAPGRIGAPRTFVAHVGARETISAEAVVKAHHRGPVSLQAIRVSTGFPFGLMRKSLLISQRGSGVVTPMPETGHERALQTAGALAHDGSPSRRAGRGDEFFALREYIHGDSPRDVAWRSSARRGTLLVRQFAAPSPPRVWIVLHLRTRPGSDADDERAIRVAAGLARAAEAQGLEYGVAAPLCRLLVHPRRLGTAGTGGQLSRVMTDLGLLDLGPDDGRGARSIFPMHAATASGGCVVVHAGPVDVAFAPRVAGVLNIAVTAEGPILGVRSALVSTSSPRRSQRAGA